MFAPLQVPLADAGTPALSSTLTFSGTESFLQCSPRGAGGREESEEADEGHEAFSLSVFTACNE